MNASQGQYLIVQTRAVIFIIFSCNSYFERQLLSVQNLGACNQYLYIVIDGYFSHSPSVCV